MSPDHKKDMESAGARLEQIESDLTNMTGFGLPASLSGHGLDISHYLKKISRRVQLEIFILTILHYKLYGRLTTQILMLFIYLFKFKII